MTAKQRERSRQRLLAYLEEMLAPLGRSERRYWGNVYLRGLLLDGERKSAGAMAPRLPEANEQNLQQFLSQSPWDWNPIWQALAGRIESAFPAPEAWVIDDTSFPKKGEHSVGVQRQYCGALGKKANGQVAVSLHRHLTRAEAVRWAFVCTCRKCGPMIPGAADKPVCRQKSGFTKNGSWPWRCSIRRSHKVCVGRPWYWPIPPTVTTSPCAGSWRAVSYRMPWQ